MINFTDVLRNIGDFPSAALTPHVSNITEAGREGARPGKLTFDQPWGGREAESPAEQGYGRVRTISRQDPRYRMYERDLMVATRLLKGAFDGDRYARLMVGDAMRGQFREALSISDFPNLFGDIIDRAVLANYRETPYTWPLVVNHADVSDFRQVKRFRIDFGTGAISNAIEMGAQYPEDKLSDSGAAGKTGQAAGAADTAGYYAYNLKKYGKRMPFFWETFVNDDLNAIKDVPARFGRGMRRGEEKFVTTLYAGNTTFFSNANFKNTVVPTGPYTATNPPLSITALAQAMLIMATQKDLDGEPIEIESVVLVVPPALKVTAQNILNADYFWANDQGGTVIGNQTATTAALTSGERLNVQNWARNIVKLAVNYYLPIVDNSNGNTGWYLFADPNGGRPALEFAHLRGQRDPQLFMKLPNSVAIGEGPMGPGMGIVPGTQNQNPMEGDFDTDAIHYKIRHVWGGTTIDPLMAVFSNGSGS